jgi:hypothetical protein
MPANPISRSDVVKQYDFVVVFEGGRHEAPHILIAPEAVCEQHRLFAFTKYPYVVSAKNVVLQLLPSL